MTTHRKFLQALLSFLVILSMTLPLTRAQPAAAQGEDGIRREVNSGSGKVNFIGPEAGQRSVSSRELGFALNLQAPSPSEAAMQLAERFAPEFGVQNPQRDLTEIKTSKEENGRVTVRYQQNYKGIPVIGGELIVNTDENGDLYSMNGEVAQDLALDTQPAISAEAALEAAKQGMVKWYSGTKEDYQASEPSLWIFDEQLLRPSSRPVELVWRIELTSAQQPIRELVLVNARTGNVSLHFNQIDTGWKKTEGENEKQTLKTNASPARSIAAQTGTTWYVTTTGDDANVCSASATPCATINAALGQASAGDMINIAEGTYTGSGLVVVTVSKSVTLTGGWDEDFAQRNGYSVIDGQSARRGIGISSGITTTIDYVVVTNGSQYYGAGIYNAGSLTLNNSALINNKATGDGGGIYSGGSLLLNNVTISGNTAGLFTGSGYTGGGIYQGSGSLTIQNSTIANNISKAHTGGGIYDGTSGTITIRNSISANNTAGIGSSNCTGTITVSENNIISNTSGCTLSSSTDDQLNLDPLISPYLAEYVHRLLPGSPAIDAGNRDTCLASDQRGMPRPQGSGCDTGAVEHYTSGGYISISGGSNQQTVTGTPYPVDLRVAVQDYGGNPLGGVTVTFTAVSAASGASGTFANGTDTTTAVTGDDGIATASTFTANALSGVYTVNATPNGYDGPVSFQLSNIVIWYVAPTGSDSNSCSVSGTPCATIQRAVDLATARDIIKVAGGTYTSSSAQVVYITKNLTISGGWDSTYTSQNETSIIDGQNTRKGITTTNNITTSIDHFTIQNGYGWSGAGISSSGPLTLDNSVIQNNIATGVGGGGGLGLGATNAVINNTLIRDNSSPSGNGGGISTYSNTHQNGTVTINNSFIGNNGNDGIYIEYASLNLNNTTIANNSGNGIEASVNAVITTQNSTIAYNTGYGLYMYSGVVATVRNSIIARNTTRDCWGRISTADHSIISNATDCSVTARTGNHLNVDAKIYSTPLGMPGYFALEGNSPAVNGGNPDTCLTADQRGVSRPQGAACDIGAFERRSTTNSPSQFGIASGENQKVLPGDTLPVPLSVYALDSNGDAVSGLNVTFTAPGSDASGIFAGAEPPYTTVIVPTDAVGIAMSPAFTTNTTIGTFIISASASGVTPVSFQVINLVWYVSPTGGAACIVSDPHCTTIQAAIDSAVAGDTIWVENGTYLENLTVSKNIILEGGWNSSFTAQDGQTIIDGENLGRNVTINSGATVSMDRFDIIGGKVANSDGGGILNSGALIFTNGAIYNNSAHHVLSTDPASNGGGIYSNGTQLTLTNVTISNNEGDVGGGLFISSGNTILNNVTITQNLATNLGVSADGGGIENANNSPITIRNSIIAGNAAEVGQDCHGAITSGGNNLIGVNTGCDFTSAAGDKIGTQPEPIHAMLGDLGDNSSSTRTHALLVGSPAIDAGNPATCATTDQRGVARPQGAACDIGAFEGAETQATTANVRTYSADSTPKWPGRFLCDNTTLPCTDGSDPEANKAHQYAIGTYNMYLSMHGRKGIDHNNMPVISTVHYCRTEECPYDNAMWSGAQILYGEGHANADDIVAHEYTHGVTQYESNLFYFHQSGAINESFSDMWGEYYDQTNGLGNDADNVKWLIGEDSTGTTPGAMRSMKNPPAFGDPDKMTSTLYVKTDIDSGGVHYNSGINNKAVYLMVDGGSFNAKTVIGIGWEKTLTIYYEAQTNLLTSGSDYSDLYYTLQQACLNVTGEAGITANDCLQVKNALEAVQMNKPPVANFNPDTTLCPAGMSTAPSLTLFEDDFENGTGKWDLDSSWELDEHNASSGSHDMWGNDTIDYADGNLSMASSVQIPSGSTYLFFKHAFAFDYWRTQYYDGAVLEYSKDAGPWLDARPLFSAGQNYKGTILRWYSNGVRSDNAIMGRSAFVGDSHGYVSSRYSLKSLAGQNVMFRWRFATDWDYSYMGWFVDDVKIYRCLGTPAIPTLQAPPSNALLTTYMPTLNWTDAVPSLDHYQVQVATDADFEEADLVLDQDRTVSDLTLTTALDPNQKYFWRVQAFNSIDQSRGWSAVRYFRTAMLRPTLVEPVGGSGLLNKRPTLEWDDTQGATGYNVQLARVSNFSTVLVKGTSKTSAFTPTVDLLPNTLYYWRVQATGLNGPSLWSSNGSFVTGKPPSIPALLAPASNALLYTTQPKLDWKNSTAPAPTTVHHYRVQVATDAAFEEMILEQDTSGPTSELSPTLDPNQKYYWRVRAYNGDNATGHYSAWSAVRYFRVAMLQPVLVSPINGTSVAGLKPVFEWDDVTGATGYTIQVSSSPTFGTLLINTGTTLSGYTSPKNLPTGKTLYWRVRANGPNGPTQWTTSTFIID